MPYLGVVDSGRLKMNAGQSCQFSVYLQRDNALRAVRQKGSHVAGARTDLQHLLVFLHRQVLQQTRFNAWCQHDFTAWKRYLHVHEGEGFVGQWNEIFAFHDRQKIQHVRVQHVPRANLLLDHVESGLLKVHRVVQSISPVRFNGLILGAETRLIRAGQTAAAPS